jgi:hypothetical protein
LKKIEEKQYGKDSRRKASAQQYIFVRRVLNKHGKVTTMREVYWECPIGIRWAWKDTDIPLVDRTEAHNVLFSL